MDPIHARRQGLESKQGFSPIAAPPLPLMAIFAIVGFLLSLTHYTTYKEVVQYTMFNLKIVLYLAPVFLVFLLRSTLLRSGGRWLDFRWPSRQQGRQQLGGGAAAFPWGMAALVVALLLLLSYRSSFQSKWFPYGTSDY